MNNPPIQPLAAIPGLTGTRAGTLGFRHRERWIEAAPLLAGLLWMGVTELGLRSLATDTTTRYSLSHAGVWLFQSLITGHLAIAMATALLLGKSGLRRHGTLRGQQPTSRSPVILTPLRLGNQPVAGLDRRRVWLYAGSTCLGWTLAFVLRASGAFPFSPAPVLEPDIIMVLLVFALGILAASTPFVWQAVHVQRRVSTAVCMIMAILALAVCIQCCTTATAPRDPAHLYTLNSALIAGVVVAWLMAISRQPTLPAKDPTRTAP